MMVSVVVSVKIKKKHCLHKSIYFWNPATCSCKNGKYVRNMGDSVIICDEIIDAMKTIPTKSTFKNCFNKKYVNKNLSKKMYFHIFTFY